MRILHTEWSNGWGGQEIRILQDALVLTDMGHQVSILACPEGGLAQKAKECNLPVVLERFKHAYDAAALLRVARLIRKERFHVVNTHSSVDSWVVSMASKMAGTPVLVRTRHLSVPIKTHPFNFVYRWPDAIVTTAEVIRRRMIEVNGMDDDRVVSIPTGVDLEVYNPVNDPGDIRHELGLGPENRIVTMVAVLRTWKRHEIFLEAAAELATDRPELRFLVVGDGPGRNRVTEKIKALDLEGRVVMTGHREDVPRILSISDVCVLTSESSEGVPQSVLQYQAMARPVVACEAGGIPEVVLDGRSGLLCPINDAAAVARSVARILDDPGLAENLGRTARRQVEESHSLAVMASSTLGLYERIYRNKIGRAPM